MNIKKITLENNGLKGLTVDYVQQEVGNDKRYYNNEYTAHKKHPVHKELEHAVNDLKYHALEILGFIHESTKKNEKDELLYSTKIKSVQFDEEGFLISFVRELFDVKASAVNTPMIKQKDGYHAFDTVMDIIEKIVTETELFMENKKEVSDAEIAMRYIENKKDAKMDMETFKNLPPEEQRDFATKIVEKFGGAVYMPEDISVDGVDVSKEIQDATDKQEELVEMPA